MYYTAFGTLCVNFNKLAELTVKLAGLSKLHYNSYHIPVVVKREPGVIE